MITDSAFMWKPSQMDKSLVIQNDAELVTDFQKAALGGESKTELPIREWQITPGICLGFSIFRKRYKNVPFVKIVTAGKIWGVVERRRHV